LEKVPSLGKRLGARKHRAVGGALTFLECYTKMFNMETITSRDLAHHSKEVRKMLAAGKTLRWTSHGALVALLQPAAVSGKHSKPDWISRAREAGAVNQSADSISQAIYGDRD
jgi:antitoxin (DNA-binding transcriptional repressor) of toxin-antitoxin stability system